MDTGLFAVTLERITIDVSNATVGMYVSELDRPWLETPFVFQGFEIKEREEIELLQSYCETITVDVHRGNLSPAQIRTLLSAPARPKKSRTPSSTKIRSARKPLRWLKNLLFRVGVLGRTQRESRLDKDGYPITSTVRGEARHGFNAYRSLSQAYEEIVEVVAQTGKVPLDILKQPVGAVIDSILRNPDAMAWTVFSRRQSRTVSGRAVGTSVWCVMFGRHLAFDRQRLQDLAIGGLLLDIGNVRLPPELVSHDGEISADKLKLIAHHVDHGLDILHRSGGFSQNVIDMLAHHHERADGSGYPSGLQGAKIPPFGRIAAIADSFDAMTTENAYSPAYAAFDVARLLNEMRGVLFPAEVVEQFLRTVGMFPTASIVELNNGTIGLVIEQNRSNALRPKVMLLLDENRNPLSQPRIVELRDVSPDPTRADALWISSGHEHGAFGINPMDYFGQREA